MKSVAVCYSEHAIKISDAYCSGPSNIIYSSSRLPNSVCDVVTSLYTVKLSTGDRFLVGFTWKEGMKPGFSIGICDYSFPLSDFCKNYRIAGKSRGAKIFEFGRWRFEVIWDLSRAEYDSSGPEPVSRFYIIILVNSERRLIIGDDANGPELKKQSSFDMGFSLISKSKHFSGNSVYSTMARFCHTGSVHEIVIKCGDDAGGVTSQHRPALSVFIDKKCVIQVKRLKWNFRGNQTVFIDGFVVDLMWDVHDLFFNPTGGCGGVFLFRTRSGSDSRLWLEESNKNSGRPEFSLLISVSKNHPG